MTVTMIPPPTVASTIRKSFNIVDQKSQSGAVDFIRKSLLRTMSRSAPSTHVKQTRTSVMRRRSMNPPGGTRPEMMTPVISLMMTATYGSILCVLHLLTKDLSIATTRRLYVVYVGLSFDGFEEVGTSGCHFAGCHK